MSIEKVRSFLAQRGREKDILEFPVSSATVELAAIAVGCAPERIAKTLSFAVEDGCVLVVCAGDAKIDNSKFKAQFHTKAKMLPAVKTYLDVSLRRFETVFPAAGSSNSAIELTCRELEELSAADGWVDVCKNWNETEESQ